MGGDLALALLLSLLLGGIAAWYLFGHVGTIGLDHGLGLDWFSPAVLFAAGHGFESPQLGVVDALDDFINQRTRALDPAALPAEVPTWAWSPFCEQHRYLIYAAGIVWRALGIDWAHLKWLSVMACAMAAALSYGLFRLAMGRALASLGTVLFMASPPVLAMLPSIRDFSKLPFLLAVILLSGWLLTRRMGLRGLYGGALAAGLTLGVGVGFRSDVLIGVAPLVAALSLAQCPVRRHGLHRFIAVALMLAVFFTAGHPVLQSMRADNGAVSSHTLAQGLSQSVHDGLRFGGAPYELVLTPGDNPVHALINTYASRNGLDVDMPMYLSAGYGEAGRVFFLDVLRTFPADVIGRAWAAVLASFQIQERAPEELAGTPIIDNEFITRWSAQWRPLAIMLARGGILFAVAGLLGLAALRLRPAFAALALTLYFCGYLSILFQFRHAFHVGFVALWYLLLCVHLALWGMRALYAAAPRAQGLAYKRGAVRAVAFALAVTLGFALPFGAARIWQHRAVGALAAAVIHAPREAIPLGRHPGDGGLYAVPETPLPELAGAEELPRMTVPYAYLAAEFTGAGEPFCMVICYGDAAGKVGHTERIWYAGGARGETLRYFFPVYRWAEVVPPEEGFYLNIEPKFARTHFLGVWIAEPFTGRFAGLDRVIQPDNLRLLPYFALSGQGGGPSMHRRFGATWPEHPCGYPQRLPEEVGGQANPYAACPPPH